MTVAEVEQVEQSSRQDNSIESRVARSLAIARYIRAVAKFENASRDFNDACQHVREVAEHGSRFVTTVDYKSYLVTVENDGSFEVVPIDVI